MEKIKCLSGDYDTGIEVNLNTSLDCVDLRVDEGYKINEIMLGKKEVQKLINQLEELKNKIL